MSVAWETPLEVCRGTNHSPALCLAEGLGAGKREGLGRLLLGRRWVFVQVIASTEDGVIGGCLSGEYYEICQSGSCNVAGTACQGT